MTEKPPVYRPGITNRFDHLDPAKQRQQLYEEAEKKGVRINTHRTT